MVRGQTQRWRGEHGDTGPPRLYLATHHPDVQGWSVAAAVPPETWDVPNPQGALYRLAAAAVNERAMIACFAATLDLDALTGVVYIMAGMSSPKFDDTDAGRAEAARWKADTVAGDLRGHPVVMTTYVGRDGTVAVYTVRPGTTPDDDDLVVLRPGQPVPQFMPTGSLITALRMLCEAYDMAANARHNDPDIVAFVADSKTLNPEQCARLALTRFPFSPNYPRTPYGQ